MRVVFDLDGTLADDTHRQHHLTQGDTKDWDQYFDACHGDKPILQMTALLRALGMAGHTVEIWSGRPEPLRDKTVAWLESWGFNMKERLDPWRLDPPHLPPCIITLLKLRPKDDYRPNEILKQEWLEQARAEERAPRLAFDDNKDVIDMFRKHGIPCCQVVPGLF